MSVLDSRLKKLEGEMGNLSAEPLFLHITFVRPSRSGPEGVQPLCYESRLHDGQRLLSEPGESIEAFQQRIVDLDTEYRRGCACRIIDITEASFDSVWQEVKRSDVSPSPINPDMSPQEAYRIYKEFIK